MLILKSKITITQNPIDTYPNRNNVIIFDFVNNIECSSTWQNLSDTGNIIFPRNLLFKDKFGKISDWNNQNVSVPNGSKPPLVLRGDSIKIELGYEYEKTKNTFVTEMNVVFSGYISHVKNKIPLEISFEDNMWLLKQIQAPNKTFNGSLEEMMKELLIGTPFTFKDTISGTKINTTFGAFTTQNETIAEVLDRLQKDFRFESSFRGNELRCGSVVYFPEDSKKHNFKFQHNIISDDLEYKRKDDVKVGIEIHTHQLIPLDKKNKDGTTKFKTEKQDYFGYFDKGNLKIVEINNKPNAFDGEIRTINMMKMPVDQVNDYIKKQLNRLSYEGWRGKFTTFGLPLVNYGDVVNLTDEVLPERNGSYMVKSVDTKFGVDGFRQEIGLDLKIDDFSEYEIKLGL